MTDVALFLHLTGALLFASGIVVAGTGFESARRPKQARKLATRLAAEGEATSAELRALIDDPTSRIANYAASSLVVAILALMVFKP